MTDPLTHEATALAARLGTLSPDARTLCAYYAAALSEHNAKVWGFVSPYDNQIAKATRLSTARIWTAKNELIDLGIIAQQKCFIHRDGEEPRRQNDRIRPGPAMLNTTGQ